ncbi:MAG TPA: isoprenylcysteine carboxylmethyltransferase family protein, partial [Verrucomicrobiae bacterium]|nr:isoprenylcysteine carboxylmethyltransferase family protein [Verrucomicrobiae bacterium]
MTLTITLLLGKIPWWGINTRIWSLGTAQRMLGCVMTFMGVAVLIWSRISLGTNWSAMVNFREGQELVERGPYRFVRHPMYSGLLLMVAGTAIAMGT